MIRSDTILAALQQLVRFVGRERTGGYRTAMTSSFSRRAEAETPTEQAPAEIRRQLEHGEVDAVLTQGVRGRHPATAFPRHPDRRLLAQPGRALLRRPDLKAAPARGPSRNPGTRTGYPRRYRHRQRQPLSLDQVGRRHPRHHQTLLSAHPGYRRTPKRKSTKLGNQDTTNGSRVAPSAQAVANVLRGSVGDCKASGAVPVQDGIRRCVGSARHEASLKERTTLLQQMCSPDHARGGDCANAIAGVRRASTARPGLGRAVHHDLDNMNA